MTKKKAKTATTPKKTARVYMAIDGNADALTALTASDYYMGSTLSELMPHIRQSIEEENNECMDIYEVSVKPVRRASLPKVDLVFSEIPS